MISVCDGVGVERKAETAVVCPLTITLPPLPVCRLIVVPSTVISFPPFIRVCVPIR